MTTMLTDGDVDGGEDDEEHVESASFFVDGQDPGLALVDREGPPESLCLGVLGGDGDELFEEIEDRVVASNGPVSKVDGAGFLVRGPVKDIAGVLEKEGVRVDENEFPVLCDEHGVGFDGPAVDFGGGVGEVWTEIHGKDVFEFGEGLDAFGVQVFWAIVVHFDGEFAAEPSDDLDGMPSESVCLEFQ